MRIEQKPETVGIVILCFCILYSCTYVLGADGAPSVDKTGLLHYWSFDEGTGSIIHDSVGDVNGTLINGVSWTNQSIYGEALEFDGANGYVALDADFSNFTNGYTIAFWAYPTGFSYPYSQTFIDLGNGRDSDNILIERWQDSNTLHLNLLYGSSGDWRFVDDFVDLNKWQHCIVTENSAGEINFYKNGAKVQTTYGLIPKNILRTKNYLGKNSWPDARNYQGLMDELIIFGRALSDSEAEILYKYGLQTNPPIADAGEDKQVYANIDGMAAITLDGSGSSNTWPATLTYTWTYKVNGRTETASGVKPTLTLPAGIYTFTLVVNNGQYDSQPDEVTVEIVGPLKISLKIPAVLNLQSKNSFTAQLIFPSHLGEQIDPYSIALAAEPNVKASYFDLSVEGDSIIRCDVCFAGLPTSLTTPNETIKIFGSFRSGRVFYGEETIQKVHSRR